MPFECGNVSTLKHPCRAWLQERALTGNEVGVHAAPIDAQHCRASGAQPFDGNRCREERLPLGVGLAKGNPRSIENVIHHRAQTVE